MVLTCTACGARVGTSAGPRSAATSVAEVTIEREAGDTSSVLVPSTATLRCGASQAATGYLADHAVGACALVRSGVLERLVKAQHTQRICNQVYGGPQYARIHGTVHARAVDITVTRGDGCGAGDWQVLAAMLGDPARNYVPDATVGDTAGAATTTTAGPSTYEVQRGDTVTSISAHFGVRAGDLVKLNHLANPDSLTPGQSLLIPPVTERLEIVPPLGPAGTAFTLTLHGAVSGESVTFTIVTPSATTTGPSHVAGSDGVAKAHYQSAPGDPTGVVTVTAQGTAGTHVQGAFLVAPPKASGAP